MTRLASGKKDFWREDQLPVSESAAAGVPDNSTEKAASSSSTDVSKRGPENVANGTAPHDDRT